VEFYKGVLAPPPKGVKELMSPGVGLKKKVIDHAQQIFFFQTVRKFAAGPFSEFGPKRQQTWAQKE
jgi:hypothetical protein